MESPVFDDFDAIIHLASNEASVVLEAEQALFGGANPTDSIRNRSTTSSSAQSLVELASSVRGSRPNASMSTACRSQFPIRPRFSWGSVPGSRRVKLRKIG